MRQSTAAALPGHGREPGPPLPSPRGPLSAQLLSVLREEPGSVPQLAADARRLVAGSADALTNDDLQLSLLVVHELHHQGWSGVDDRWEWHPDLVALAAELEAATERGVRALVADRLPAASSEPTGVPEALGA